MVNLTCALNMGIQPFSRTGVTPNDVIWKEQLYCLIDPMKYLNSLVDPKRRSFSGWGGVLRGGRITFPEQHKPSDTATRVLALQNEKVEFIAPIFRSWRIKKSTLALELNDKREQNVEEGHFTLRITLDRWSKTCSRLRRASDDSDAHVEALEVALLASLVARISDNPLSPWSIICNSVPGEACVLNLWTR